MIKFSITKMKLTPIVTFIFATATINVSKAQQQNYVEKVSSVQASILYPSMHYSYENQWGVNSTYEIRGGIEGGFEYHSYNSEVKETLYTFNPTLDLGYKYYYNMEKRAQKGKNIANNAANFFGISLVTAIGQYTVGVLRYEQERYKENVYNSGVQFSLVPKWGINRMLGKNAAFNLQLGPAITTDLADLSVGVYSHIGFSYAFKQRILRSRV